MSVDLAVSLLLALANQAGRISAVVSQAQSEGRTQLTAEEWSAAVSADDAAKIKQEAALAKAKSEGR